VVFIGHVDAGKSTIGGQILYLTGGVDERTIQKYERCSFGTSQSLLFQDETLLIVEAPF
jgi:translation elongation factor EF-1alpha